MRTTTVVFPFDVYGGGGTGAGAQLLGDVVREILRDARREIRPCRAACLRERVRVREYRFATPAEVYGWRTTGRRAARVVFQPEHFTLWLGGNHLSVLPVLDVLGPDTLVIQFDAHLDVYSFHDTTRELCHGNYLNELDSRRPRLVNVGHRDLFLTRAEIARTFEATYPADRLACDLTAACAELRARAVAAPRLWLDLDADVFDPAALPAVQAPLPFGLNGPDFLALLDAVWGRNVVGLSVSEFDPGRDQRDTGLSLLAWLIEYVLLRVHEAG